MGNDIFDKESEINAESQNLTISNKLKGLLAVQYNGQTLRVVENLWKGQVQKFQGAFVAKKFAK